MLTSDQIKEMFPLEIEVTKKMLQEGEKTSMQKCFGALALKSVFPDNRVFWLNSIGHIECGKLISVRSVEPDDEEKEIQMMCLKSPRKVKFVLR